MPKNLKNSNLVFEDKEHIYRLMPSGMILPSVTEIIGAVFPFTGKGEAVERAARFGEAFHKASELDIKGTLNWATVDEALLPYIKQASMALASLGILTIRCKTEVKLFSKKYLFAGKIDLVENIILDYKTGQEDIKHRIQISAYRKLWNENNPKEKKERGVILYLNGSDNMPKIVEEKPQDFSVFLSCLNIHNFRKAEGLK